MDNVRAQGLQQAYQQAQQNLQYGSNLGLQGLQGAQQGLGTALQGGQLGLSGIGTALQGLQGGMQGSGLGIQGAQAGLQGVDRQLAGTAQGMQGAQVGLQGVSGAQAGYGLADRAAGTLGTLGQQQLAAQTGILGLQNQIGAQQQAQEQQYINQGIQNFAQAQENPMQRYNQLNALVRGYALPGTTQTQYQAQPTLANQALGFGTAGIAGLGLYNAMNRG
jgi:type IV secretory pathway TrbL component